MNIVRAIVALALGAVAGELLARWPSFHEIFGRRDWSTVIAGRHPMPVSANEIRRWTEALTDQFGDVEKFRAAMATTHSTEKQLKQKIVTTLAAENWIEKEIAPSLTVTPEEIATYYATHQSDFMQPARAYVRHLFVAAPVGSPDDLVAQKRELAENSLEGLNKGEDFAHHVAAVSEDEATKDRGGALGWISAPRVPPEFFAEIEKLPVGAEPVLFQSHLGFHLSQVLAREPARAQPLSEAAAEITARLAAGKRKVAVERVARQFAAQHRGVTAN